MSRAISPYYPPRARWYSPIFSFGSAIRRLLALDHIRLPKQTTFFGLIASLLVPGLGVYLRGPRFIGLVVLGACGLLLVSFIAWLGYPLSNYAFGLLVSIHATGFIYYCSSLVMGMPFRYRLGFTLLVLIAIYFVIYTPLRTTIQERWLMPLKMNGHVIVVKRLASVSAVRRGDWVAYTLATRRLYNHGGGGSYERRGLDLGPVLAVAGDRVEFLTNVVKVNGISHPLLPHMPASGTIEVPENHWFIWPNVGMSGHGNIGESRVSDAMLQMADVSEAQFVGKPFTRWFWRRQTLP